jgi:RNA polymerase sigma-70 factor (ECF subfamily)
MLSEDLGGNVMHGDGHLISRAAQGDRAALAEIYEQHQPSIYTYIFYRVGDRALAEDLTADVFVRVAEKAHTFVDQGRPLLAWLYTIARNVVIDHFRHKGSTTLLPWEEGLAKDEADCSATAIEHCLTQADLATAMQRLTEAQRQVILLRFVEGRSRAEVAAILGKNQEVVKSLQHRALATLRRELERNGFANED